MGSTVGSLLFKLAFYFDQASLPVGINGAELHGGVAFKQSQSMNKRGDEGKRLPADGVYHCHAPLLYKG